MNHELKCWPEFFDAVDRGDKTFEVRRDDRGFQVGDTLRLHRYRPGLSVYGGERYVDRDDRVFSPYPLDGTDYDAPGSKTASIVVRVTYKLPGGRFGIDPLWCVLGFVRATEGEQGGGQ